MTYFSSQISSVVVSFKELVSFLCIVKFLGLFFSLYPLHLQVCFPDSFSPWEGALFWITDLQPPWRLCPPATMSLTPPCMSAQLLGLEVNFSYSTALAGVGFHHCPEGGNVLIHRLQIFFKDSQRTFRQMTCLKIIDSLPQRRETEVPDGWSRTCRQ